MRKYKGHYIDGVLFNNEKEVDKFIENELVRNLKHSVECFNREHSLSNADWVHDCEQALVHNCNYTWDEVENLVLTF